MDSDVSGLGKVLRVQPAYAADTWAGHQSNLLAVVTVCSVEICVSAAREVKSRNYSIVYQQENHTFPSSAATEEVQASSTLRSG